MNYQVTEDELLATADAIRLKSGGSSLLQWESGEGFADAIEDIPPGGILVSKSVTANGTYDPADDSADGYSSVSVNVPGATLVEKSITANGNYYPGNDNADGYSAVYVAVEGSNLVPKTVTANGVYDPEDENVDGYLSVTVNVPNSYSASDEGKVVDDGALVSQTSTTVTTNGTVDTTLNDEVVVSVPNSYESSDEGKVVSSGALVPQTSTTKTANGTYDTTLNNEVVVNVPGSADLGTKSITANGTYTATDDSLDGYSSVTVNVSGSGGIPLLSQAQWDALNVSEKQAYGYVGVYTTESGYNRGKLYYGANCPDFYAYYSGWATSSAEIAISIESASNYTVLILAMNSEASTKNLTLSASLGGTDLTVSTLEYNSYHSSSGNFRNSRMVSADFAASAGDVLTVSLSDQGPYSSFVYLVVDQMPLTVLKMLSTADALTSGSYSENCVAIYGTFDSYSSGTVNVVDDYVANDVITTSNPGSGYRSSYIVWLSVEGV